MNLGRFLICIPLSVSTGLAIGSVMTNKILQTLRPDHRGKVMYFRDDQGKITLAPHDHRVCFRNRRDDAAQPFVNKIHV